MSTNIQLIKVANGDKGSLRICLSGQWLPDMGFIPRALVRIRLEPGGVTFTLCDDPSPWGHGDRFMWVPSTDGRKVKCPVLVAKGKYLHDTGLNYGDPLIARYSPGFIRVRRFPVKAKAIVMIDNQIRLSGGWLTESGFLPDTVALTLSEPGRIVVKKHGGASTLSDYAGLVRFARQNKMKIIQFHHNANSKAPGVNISGSCVDKAGFASGDVLVAYYEHDLIVIQRLDLGKLGF